MKTLNKTGVAIVMLAILAGPLISFAFTPAPSNPPTGNVSAPLNAGPENQTKLARVRFNANNATVGLLVHGSESIYGKVGIGLTHPPECDTTNPSNIECVSYKLQVGKPADGSSVGANGFFYLSDAMFKTNIKPIDNALEQIMKLRGVSFTWKTTGKSDVGVIAQEVEKVYPEVVNTASNGIKSVDYGHLVGPLIEAIKTQQKEIEALKARVTALEAVGK